MCLPLYGKRCVGTCVWQQKVGLRRVSFPVESAAGKGAARALGCAAFPVWPAWYLFVWSSEPKASSVFTLRWHVWQKLVNTNYPTLAEHDCWINKNTSCWADEPWMLIWCLEVVQSPIPWQQPVELNWTCVGINSSLFFFFCAGKLMDFGLSTCDVHLKAFSFQNYLFTVLRRTGKHISGGLVERKKNCCNEFKRRKKKQAKFDKLVWTLLTVKPLIYDWANFQVFSLDA